MQHKLFYVALEFDLKIEDIKNIFPNLRWGFVGNVGGTPCS